MNRSTVRLLVLAALASASSVQAADQTAAPYGRLFHSPDERLLIDHPPPPSAPEEPAAEGPVRLDGIIRRSDGRTVIWVDGRPTTATEAQPTASGSAAVLSLPNGERRRLRVGESIVPGAGR
ncbi:MAG: hypothetical protein KDH17_09490 [Rhodocyclaceae bacterium]|nr:hypothetical protein [Rhodocyclaceae bacterium]